MGGMLTPPLPRQAKHGAADRSQGKVTLFSRGAACMAQGKTSLQATL